MTKGSRLNHETLYICAALFLFTGIAFVLHWNRAAYSDIAWLLHGARIIYEGGNFADYFFETNPPYNTVFYIPAIIIQDFTGYPLHQSSILYLVPLTVLVVYLTLVNIRDYALIYKDQVFFYLACLLYIFMNLILVEEQLAQRDVLAGLGTFLILSVILKYRDPKSYLQYRSQPLHWIAITIGTLMALLKPHWGILIIGAMIWRCSDQKRLSVLFDFDFLLLALITALYFWLSMLFFPDFFTQILPFVLSIYLITATGYGYIMIFITLAHFLFLSYAALTLAKEMSFDTEKMRLLKTTIFFAFLAMIPALLQQKGFLYHYYSHYIVLCLCFLWLLYEGIHLFFGRYKIFTIPLPVIFISTLFTLLTFFAFQLPTKQEYFENHKLAQVVHKYSEPGEYYFIANENMGLVLPLNLYINRNYGSRFPSYWFLASLRNEGRSEQAQEKYRRHFAHLVGEDFARYEPKVFIHVRSDLEYKNNKLSLPEYLSASPLFNNQWDQYFLAETLILNRKEERYVSPLDEFGNDEIIYDVFVRKD